MSAYLFLDVDGVLNNYYSEGEHFVQYNMDALKSLCDFIDFKIVLSSDWRRTPQNRNRVKHELKALGLELYSYTPLYTFGGNRKDEIKGWLQDDDNFSGLILDDMSAEECDPELPNLLFYRTNYKLGLTEQDVDIIIGKMNEQVR